MTTPRVPTSVTRGELLEALAPLLSLLSVSADEVLSNGPGLMILTEQIRFVVCARAEGDDREFPAALQVPMQSHPQGDEFAEYAYPISVEIVG